MLQLHRQAIRPYRGVKRGGDAKKLEEHPETHTRPPLEKTANGEREKERHEKNENRETALWVSDRVVNIVSTITARCCLGQVAWRARKGRSREAQTT